MTQLRLSPQIAEKLHLAQVSYVEEVVEAAEDHVVVKRQFEDGYHIVKGKNTLPADSYR